MGDIVQGKGFLQLITKNCILGSTGTQKNGMQRSDNFETSKMIKFAWQILWESAMITLYHPEVRSKVERTGLKNCKT